MDMLVKFPNSRAMLMILNGARNRFSMDRLEEALGLFNAPELVEHPLYKDLVTYRETMMKTAVGQVVPDFSLPSKNGKEVAISSFRGKYVLLDFWASWCGPCRGENPHVVEIYKEYHPKGLEIFGVSLDNNKEAWVKAIADDGLVWKHGSDLKGWQSAPAQLYSVSGIPHTVLLDENNKIIAKNLRGDELKQKIAELLK